MREFAFSTFLKLLELQDKQRESAIKGLKRGGGFQYWRPLFNLAPEIVRGKLDTLDIPERVALMASGHQQKYNEAALAKLAIWVGRYGVEYRSRPERIVEPIDETVGLAVRIEPEVAFATDGDKHLMHVWATKNPILSERTLSMGLAFFRDVSRAHGHNDCRFLILDTVRDRTFVELNIVKNARLMLQKEIDDIVARWADDDHPDEGLIDVGEHPPLK